MSDEPIEMYDEDGVVYAVYEDENGETYTKIYGYLDEDEDDDDGEYYVDVSGDFGGEG